MVSDIKALHLLPAQCNAMSRCVFKKPCSINLYCPLSPFFFLGTSKFMKSCLFIFNTVLIDFFMCKLTMLIKIGGLIHMFPPRPVNPKPPRNKR